MNIVIYCWKHQKWFTWCLCNFFWDIYRIFLY